MGNENIKERIVKRASEMFAKQGCKLVTMDEIASLMGISKRTIYEQFANKDALVEACITNFYEEGDADMERIITGGENILTALLTYTRTVSQAMMQLRYNFFVEVKKYFPQVFDNTVLKFRQKHTDNARRMVSRGKRDGVFMRNIDENIAAELITGVCRDIFSGAFNISIADKHRFVGNLVYYYMRGISTPLGIELLDKMAKSYRRSWLDMEQKFVQFGIGR